MWKTLIYWNFKLNSRLSAKCFKWCHFCSKQVQRQTVKIESNVLHFTSTEKRFAHESFMHPPQPSLVKNVQYGEGFVRNLLTATVLLRPAHLFLSPHFDMVCCFNSAAHDIWWKPLAKIIEKPSMPYVKDDTCWFTPIEAVAQKGMQIYVWFHQACHDQGASYTEETYMRGENPLSDLAGDMTRAV